MDALRRGLCVAALCIATAAQAQSPQQVTGEVTNVFGDRFVLQTDSESFLVTTPPDGTHPRPGQHLTVTGARDGNQIVASEIQPATATEPQSGVAEETLPPALRGLGLELIGSRDWPHGKRELLTRLPDGTRIEIEIDRDGSLREIEAEGRRAVMPTAFLDRFVSDAVARHPQLQTLSGLRKIEISANGSVEIEGYSASGEEIEAEFDHTGRLIEFDID